MQIKQSLAALGADRPAILVLEFYRASVALLRRTVRMEVANFPAWGAFLHIAASRDMQTSTACRAE